MDVEFTSRYGDRVPSMLRVCLGACEGMGSYPVNGRVPYDETSAESRYESREIRRLIAEHGRADDDWYFVRCPDCGGAGHCSWLSTIARFPGWFVKSVRFCRTHGPSSMCWHGHPATWSRRAWLTFKAAFLCDLGLRM